MEENSQIFDPKVQLKLKLPYMGLPPGHFVCGLGSYAVFIAYGYGFVVEIYG